MKIKQIYLISEELNNFKELCSVKKLYNKDTYAIMYANKEELSANSNTSTKKIFHCEKSDELPLISYADAISKIIEDDSLILINNSINGRLLAAKLSVLLDSPSFTNATDIKACDDLSFKQSVYGGAGLREIKPESKHVILTVNPGCFEIDENLENCSDIEVLNPEINKKIKLLSTAIKQENSVNIALAKNIVDVGRGIADEEKLADYIKLSKLIGAELGCSRPVAENLKILPKSVYIGITGVQLKPNFILVAGVSGQIQHLAGINNSKYIVAINKDKDAPIFKNCDFGIIGDMNEVAKKLISALSA